MKKQDNSVVNTIRKYLIKVITESMQSIERDPKYELTNRKCGVTVILFNNHKTTAEPFVIIAIKAPHFAVANRIRYRISRNFVRNMGIRYLYIDNFSYMKDQAELDFPCECKDLRVLLDKADRAFSPVRTLYSFKSPHTGKIVMEYQVQDFKKTPVPNCITHMVIPEVKHQFRYSENTTYLDNGQTHKVCGYNISQIMRVFSNVSKELYNDIDHYSKDWYAFIRVYLKIYSKAPGGIKTSDIILDKTITI